MKDRPLLLLLLPIAILTHTSFVPPLARPSNPNIIIIVIPVYRRRALWVAFVVVMVTRFLRRILRAVSNLLGFGLDEEEMLGIKHHKKQSSSKTGGGGGGSKGSGKGAKGGGGKGGGGKRAAAAAAAAAQDDSSDDSEEDDKPMGVVKKPIGMGNGKRNFKGKGGGGGGGDEASHKLHVNTLKGHTDTVNMVSFSGDGKAIVTACDDMTVRLFRLGDAVTSKNPHILRIPLDKERATGVAFASPGATGKGRGRTDGRTSIHTPRVINHVS